MQTPNLNAPDPGILDVLKGYNDRMTISQAVIFFERRGYNITKTMIQNYIRVFVLPPPVDRRRYTKNHIFFILLIDCLKSIYSLDEIRELFAPVVAEAFSNGDPDKNMAGVYKSFCDFYEMKFKLFSTQTKTDREGPFINNLSIAAESVACRNYIVNSNSAPKPES